MSWSTDVQTPEFLAATRMISLGDSVIATILERLKLEPGMRVLDVGCGSGEYCFRLGSATQGMRFTGIDIDPAFVEFANKRATNEVGYPYEDPNPANSYRFIYGDGLDLPFEDGSFDAVVSHTYLTAVPDWACAFAEMCRVCKKGGTVSSITSLTDDFYGTGSISLFTGLLNAESVELLELVEKAKARLAHGTSLVSGIAPRKVPVSFDWMGLEDISCTPLPHYFCLSDAAVTEAERKRNIELLALMETSQMARLKAAAETADMLSDGQWSAYEDLIRFRREALIDCNENREWNWYGNASLLVCGTVPEGGIPVSRLAFREASIQARGKLQSCLDTGLVTHEETTQLGPGRCVKTALSRADGSKLAVYGFDPPRALGEACGVVLEDDETANRDVEAEFRATRERADALPDFPNADIYGIPDMWETVSEAVLDRISVTFKDAGAHGGPPTVACIIAGDDRASEAIASHADYREAAMRAFARAYGSYQQEAGEPQTGSPGQEG